MKKRGLMDFKLSAPIEIRLELTRECNLHCIHCYNESHERLHRELTYTEIKDIIDQLEEMRVFDIVIEGGELFLRSDIWDILQYMARKFKLGISTNGTYIGDTEARRLAKLVDYIQVSIDGATSYTNDSIRGKGTFARALRAVKSLVSAGIPTGISMVLMRQNASEVRKFVKLGENLGVTACAFSRLQILGRAKKNLSRIALSREEFIKIQREINTIVLNGPKIKIQRPLYCFSFLLVNPTYTSSYRGGLGTNIECVEGLAILPNGDVIPCPGLPGFIAGNTREKRIKEIWQKSPVLEQLRKISVKGKCNRCRFFPLCRGGCRGEAYLETGSLELPDPLCWLFENGEGGTNDAF